jgi:LysM repeat protein
VEDVEDVEDTETHKYVVKSGDNFSKIAQNEKTTVGILTKLNPKASTLQPGQVLYYKKASLKKVITAWQPINTELIAKKYNAGGDKNYAEKLGYCLSIIDKQISSMPIINSMHMIFHISQGLLTVYTEDGGKYDIMATSGKDKCQNNPSEDCQKKSFEGPIPVGIYYLNPKDMSDPNFAMDLARNLLGDWGDWRIVLKPAETTQTHRRNNFFIHGGRKKGSAGCIDIGGGILGDKQTDRLKKDILASKKEIRLEVVI